MSSYPALSAALMVMGLVHVALSMKCMECVSKDGLEATCDSEGSNATCQAEMARLLFEALKTIQPSLKGPDKSHGFQCVAINLASRAYLKGCFYRHVDLCAEMREFRDCRTCKTDYCNAIWYKESKDGAAVVPEVSFALITALAWVSVAVTWLGRF